MKRPMIIGLVVLAIAAAGCAGNVHAGNATQGTVGATKSVVRTTTAVHTKTPCVPASAIASPSASATATQTERALTPVTFPSFTPTRTSTPTRTATSTPTDTATPTDTPTDVPATSTPTPTRPAGTLRGPDTGNGGCA